MDELINELRDILLDFGDLFTEVFEYSTSNVFYLTEPYIGSVENVTINDQELESGQSFSYDDSLNAVTVNGVSFNEGDIVKIFVKKYKYSDMELEAFIKRALLYIGVAYKNFDIVSGDVLSPTPTSEEEKLIILVATIIAEPSYTEYRLPTVSVKYAETMSLEEKITSIINRYVIFSGLWDYVQITGVGAVGQSGFGFI